METKIVDLINEKLCADGGNAFRHELKKALEAPLDAYKVEPPGSYRRHLGASLIGRECERELWLHFRFCAPGRLHDGRMIRLFNRGHLEEARFTALLRQAGLEVWTEAPKTGRQFHFEVFGGHFGGSLDGMCRGVPEIPDVPCLLEFKTHNSRSFAKIVKSGVCTGKGEHLVQMNLYMAAYHLKYALYMGVCKDDDALYAELVPCQPTLAKLFTERAMKIIFAKSVPDRVKGATSCGWYVCKYCDFQKFCWSGKKIVDFRATCRTCAHATPEMTGDWICHKTGASLSMDNQLAACEDFVLLDSVRDMGLRK